MAHAKNPMYRTMGTRVSRLRGWGISSALACLTGVPAWPAELQSEVKNVLLAAHASDAEDARRVRSNIKMHARPLVLQRLERWLTCRAKPQTDMLFKYSNHTPTDKGKTKAKSKSTTGANASSTRRQQVPRSQARPCAPRKTVTHGYMSCGRNWRCHWCDQCYDGTLKVSPPQTAPAIWCRTCKCTRRLTRATCVTCHKEWSNCNCGNAHTARTAMLAIATRSAIGEKDTATRENTRNDKDTHAATCTNGGSDPHISTKGTKHGLKR